MHEDGIVAEVSERLQQAGLMPPVKNLVWQGDEDDANNGQPWINEMESVLIEVTGPISAGLEAQLAKVLHGLTYELQSVPPNHGVMFGGGPGYRPRP